MTGTEQHCDRKFNKDKCNSCDRYDQCEKEELRIMILTREYIYNPPGKKGVKECQENTESMQKVE